MSADRRNFLARIAAGAGALALSACKGPSETEWFPKVLDSAEGFTKDVQRIFAGRNALAQEFTKADLSPVFKANGTLNPNTPDYNAAAANGFRDWKIGVGGLVDHPFEISMEQLRAMPSRTQITRHDCVEGWSCVGEWKGALLKNILAEASPTKNAKFVVFYCADPMSSDPLDPQFYYESLDLIEACHPQTILAYEMNGAPLAVPHGAPVRLRCERQLGYKHAKYVERLVLVESFAHINGGSGGYWEDNGYEWWAGI
jgi:DMSO/TMAO reductase YedYZ molybdopterin-dependent catalytic subunit